MIRIQAVLSKGCVELEKFVRNEISKVQDLDDRRLLKDIVQGVFTDIVQYDKERYQQLEAGVFQEISVDRTKYAIYTNVCSKNDYDYNNGFLYPMAPLDINKFRDGVGFYPEKNTSF